MSDEESGGGHSFVFAEWVWFLWHPQPFSGPDELARLVVTGPFVRADTGKAPLAVTAFSDEDAANTFLEAAGAEAALHRPFALRDNSETIDIPEALERNGHGLLAVDANKGGADLLPIGYVIDQFRRRLGA